MSDPQAPPARSAADEPTAESAVDQANAETVDLDTVPEPGTPDVTPNSDAERPPLDLERVWADLDGVEAALGRLDDGTYWTDEVTGAPIPDDVLATNPVARRAEGAE